MQPLKPEDKLAILNDNPAADPAEIQEYEKLLSQRFTMDPDAPAADAVADDGGFNIEQRLRELHDKLFGRKR